MTPRPPPLSSGRPALAVWRRREYQKRRRSGTRDAAPSWPSAAVHSPLESPALRSSGSPEVLRCGAVGSLREAGRLVPFLPFLGSPQLHVAERMTKTLGSACAVAPAEGPPQRRPRRAFRGGSSPIGSPGPPQPSRLSLALRPGLEIASTWLWGPA
eukprot:scaffold503_cov375-Pinguiococcus_pyrenoidosus.AAC.14